MKKEVQRKLGLLSLFAVLFVALALPAYAASSELADQYGFLAGLWDGFVWPLNFIVNLFSDGTIAADGTGVLSRPNTGLTYYMGFFMTGGTEGMLGGFLGGD